MIKKILVCMFLYLYIVNANVIPSKPSKPSKDSNDNAIYKRCNRRQSCL